VDEGGGEGDGASDALLLPWVLALGAVGCCELGTGASCGQCQDVYAKTEEKNVATQPRNHSEPVLRRRTAQAPRQTTTDTHDDHTNRTETMCSH
jgi:hypothetical protein